MPAIHIRYKLLFAFVVALLINSPPCWAEGDATWFGTMEQSSEAADTKGKSITDNIVVAPIPMANPTLGAGVIGVGMYMHPEDDFWNDEIKDENVTRQSISGIAAMVSTSKSWMTGAFHKGFYDDDRYRGTAFLAYGEFNLKYYGSGDDSHLRDNPINYSAKITAFQPTFMKKVTENWYIGPKYSIFIWDLGADVSDLSPDLPYISQTITTAGLGLVGEWDTTDHSVYAAKGGKLQFDFTDYGNTWGGDFDYAKGSVNYAHYYSMNDDLVLAGRGDLNLSTGSTPFFDMPYLHLRGFPYSKYIDKQSASVQAEARYQLSKKWAVNLFGGLGWISEKPKDLFQGDTIPTGGFGARYLVAPEQKMYLGMDVAFGPDSQALYFRLGEWF